MSIVALKCQILLLFSIGLIRVENCIIHVFSCSLKVCLPNSNRSAVEARIGLPQPLLYFTNKKNAWHITGTHWKNWWIGLRSRFEKAGLHAIVTSNRTAAPHWEACFLIHHLVVSKSGFLPTLTWTWLRPNFCPCYSGETVYSSFPEYSHSDIWRPFLLLVLFCSLSLSIRHVANWLCRGPFLFRATSASIFWIQGQSSSPSDFDPQS